MKLKSGKKTFLTVGCLFIVLGLIFCPGTRAEDDDAQPEIFHIARLNYGGGGDWYTDPSSLPNLLRFFHRAAGVKVQEKEVVVKLTDDDLFSHPYLYMTGHGNVHFTEEEVERLRAYLLAGGFLHADDCYGMDESFRREMARVFPNHPLEELRFDHPIFHGFYDFPKGLPKVHEHDGKPPQGFGITVDGRVVVFYSYETDLGDGWESPEVHNDPEPVRMQALKMGVNIIVYALTH